MAMIFKSCPESKFSMWSLVLATCAPATLLSNLILPPEPMLLTAASFFFPSMTLYSAYARSMKQKVSRRDVHEAYIFENGE